MTKEAKLTSKGQVTIPHEIRALLGIREGDRLLFEANEEGVRLEARRKESPFSKYRGIGNPGIPSGRAAIVKFFRKSRGQ